MDEPREQEVESDDGVDATLIRWMLSLTPQERLKVLSEWMNSLGRLRGAAAPR